MGAIFKNGTDGFVYEAYFVLFFSINLNHVINVHRKRNKIEIS